MNTRYKEDVQRLFEYWCEIAPPNKGEKVSGHIVSSYPEKFKDAEIIAKIPDFAYPCQFANESVQTYSFVLTSTDSKWRFGFCRHDSKSRTAMVIITYLPWHDTFIKFMNVLGELNKSDSGEFQPFLTEAYIKGVPEPGASLKLFYNAGTSNFMFQRPSQFQLPSIPENHNLNLYYNFVIPKNMIAIFAAMLAERRIVFTSNRLDKLSSCVQAANAFLYPMIWQHIFIPVLPMKMKDILCAPMPYLIGVPDAVLETMTKEELGDVVVLNCDNTYLDTPFDDVKDMPSELVSQLKKQLNNQTEHIGDRVSKIFLGILVQLIGGYRDAIKYSQGEKLTWDRDAFIESRSTYLQSYLRKIMELQIFQQFIEERLDMLNTGLGFSDEFELETLKHSDRVGRKGGKPNYKEFLRNVKDKTNPAVKSAVQSVKQGSRGVKTAYKDIRSKLHKTPTNNGIDMSRSHAQFDHHHRSGGGGGGVGAIASTSLYHSQQSPPPPQQHHSAPNSPVFTKKLSPNDLSPNHDHYYHQHHNQQHHNQTNYRNNKKPHSMLQTSSSLLNNSMKHNYIALNNNHNINNNNNSNNTNNNFSNKSPPVSQPSSNSSSEMNLLQELQQHHALFKIPTIDRSLKPTNSNTTTVTGKMISSNSAGSSTNFTSYTTLRPQRSGSLLNTSSSIKQTQQLGILTNKSSVETISLGKLHLYDDNDDDNGDNGEKRHHQQHLMRRYVPLSWDPISSSSIDSNFDTPPEMSSPPIPPRISNPPSTPTKRLQQQQQQHQQSMRTTPTAQIFQTHRSSSPTFIDMEQKSIINNSSEMSMLFDDDFVNNDLFKNITNSSISLSQLPAPLTSASSSSLPPPSPPPPPSSSSSSSLLLLTTSAASSSASPSLSQPQPQPPAPSKPQSSPNFHNNHFNNHLHHDLVTVAPLVPLRQNICTSNNDEITLKTLPQLQQQQQQQRQSNSSSNETNTMPNLINLDSISLELEDFDPLNQNAKQISSLTTTTSSKTLPYNLISGVGNQQKLQQTQQHQQQQHQTHPIIYNPVYPSYLVSPNSQNLSTNLKNNIPPVAPPRRKEIDDDSELLRKYGLDQFSFNARITAAAANNSSSGGSGGSSSLSFDNTDNNVITNTTKQATASHQNGGCYNNRSSNNSSTSTLTTPRTSQTSERNNWTRFD